MAAARPAEHHCQCWPGSSALKRLDSLSPSLSIFAGDGQASTETRQCCADVKNPNSSSPSCRLFGGQAGQRGGAAAAGEAQGLLAAVRRGPCGLLCCVCWGWTCMRVHVCGGRGEGKLQDGCSSVCGGGGVEHDMCTSVVGWGGGFRLPLYKLHTPTRPLSQQNQARSTFGARCISQKN